LSCFIVGVVGNELFLLVQSGLAMAGVAWRAAPYYLLGVAVLLFAGTAGYLVKGQVTKFISAVDGG
jgi:hypothetical protein